MNKLSQKLIDILNDQDFCFTPDEMRTVQLALRKFMDYEKTEMEPNEILEVQELLKPIEWKRYREIMEAERGKKLIVLPCKIGDTIYRIIDDCEFPGDCGTKRMCKGCEYRNLFIEENSFCISLLGNDGKLRSGYFLTKEEAEAALRKEDER